MKIGRHELRKTEIAAATAGATLIAAIGFFGLEMASDDAKDQREVARSQTPSTETARPNDMQPIPTDLPEQTKPLCTGLLNEVALVKSGPLGDLVRAVTILPSGKETDPSTAGCAMVYAPEEREDMQPMIPGEQMLACRADNQTLRVLLDPSTGKFTSGNITIDSGFSVQDGEVSSCNDVEWPFKTGMYFPDPTFYEESPAPANPAECVDMYGNVNWELANCALAAYGKTY